MPTRTTSALKAVAAIAFFSLSACATVDVTAIGAADAEAEQLQVAEQDGNVITRAVMRLQDVFVDKGWHEDQSRKQVQSAASILLNGLQKTVSGTPRLINASTGNQMLIDDIKTARYHISQTTKAAEVYMNVASSDADFKLELNQLQKALQLSEAVQVHFKDEAFGTNVDAHLELLASDVKSLRVITDEFGEAVRSRSIALNIKPAS